MTVEDYFKWLDVFNLSSSERHSIVRWLLYIKGPVFKPAWGIVQVADVYIRLSEGDDFKSWPGDYNVHLKAARLIVDKRKIFSKTNPRYMHHISPKRETSVLSGLYEDYPLYSLLYYIAPDGDKTFERLQQALIVIYRKFQRDGKEFKPGHLVSCCRAFRRITTEHYGEDFLERHSAADITSVEILAGIVDAEHDDGLEGAEETYKDAHLLIDNFLGREVKTRKTTTRNRSSGYKLLSQGVNGRSLISTYSELSPVVFGDVDDELEQAEVLSLQDRNYSINDCDKQELSAAGIEAYEDDSEEQYLFTQYDDLSNYARVFQAKMRAQGAKSQVKRQNQYLNYSNSRLNASEIEDIHGVITEDFNEDIMARTLLLIVLLTSSEIKVAKNLRFLDSSKDIKIDIDGLGYDLQRRLWLVSCYSPTYQTKEKKELKAVVSSSTAKFLAHYEPSNGVHSKLVELNKSTKNSTPFKGRKKLEARVKKLLSNRSHRITIKKVERLLALNIASTEEATVATYCLNYYLPTSSARAYYTNLDVQFYQRCYQSARRWLASTSPCNFLFRYDEAPSLSRSERIGARYHPKTDHVKNVITGLQRDLHEFKRSSVFNWIDFHNTYTLLSIYSQGLVTGIRAVQDPFVGTDKILSDYKLAVITDKVGEDKFHTRNIPMHNLAIEIADKYAAHRKAALNRLVLLNSDSYYQQSNPDSHHSFFLDSKGSVIEARPKEIKSRLAPYTSLPINSNRKLLRNHLIEHEADYHAIDTLLGHAAMGETYWENESSISFNEIRSCLIPALDKLIEVLGIEVFDGLTLQ